MPFYSVEYQREFNWRLQPRTIYPLADVVYLGEIAYFKCCPGCGCFHPVPRNKVTGAVKLSCTLRKYAEDQHIQRTTRGQLFRRQYDKWLERWPIARDCDRAYCRVVPLYAGDPDVPAPAGNIEVAAPKVVPNGTTKRQRKAKVAA